MESYAYSSYPDSGDSSPRSREVDSENGSHHHHHAADDLHPPSNALPNRVKLMISYGGRIQLRPHDNQLSYLNGETKILAVDRAMRFADFHSKLATVCGTDEVCIKYQLPGEDLDALISVTNDEDLEHMVLEFDRLHYNRSSNSSRSTPRLRVFLFPINPPPPSPALLEPKQERHWFMEALNSIPPLPPQVQVSATPACNGHSSPDYLFGLDNGFVPPPAVKVKDPTPPEQPAPRDTAAVEIPIKEERQIGSDPPPGGSPPEIQRQIQELEKLQVTDNQPSTQTQPQTQPPPQVQPQTQTQPQAVITMPRNGSDETLANRAFPPKTQEKPPAPAPVQSIQQLSPQAPPATAVPQPTMTAPTGYIPRFQSIAGGDHQQPVYVFSHAPHGYFAAAPPGTASFVYAMPPPAPNHSAGGGGGGDISAGYGGGQVTAAYDNAGRTVYYTSMMPAAYHHQAVTSVALTNTESPKPVKPSQVS